MGWRFCSDEGFIRSNNKSYPFIDVFMFEVDKSKKLIVTPNTYITNTCKPIDIEQFANIKTI